jgi:hypothetical protein
MSDSYNDVEAHIQAVLASILSETKLISGNCTRLHGFLINNFEHGYNEQKNRSNCKESDHILSDDQELTLCQILDHEEADETSLCIDSFKVTQIEFLHKMILILLNLSQ